MRRKEGSCLLFILQGIVLDGNPYEAKDDMKSVGSWTQLQMSPRRMKISI